MPDLSFEVGRESPLRLVFARSLDPASVTGSTVRLLDGVTGQGVPATLSYDSENRTVTVVPDAPLDNHAPYRITVGAVTDLGGRIHSGSFSATFTTLTTAPPMPRRPLLP